MPTTAPDQSDARQPVAVGVLRRRDRRLLMQQRTPGQACAGQWEFPGGKVEPGETPRRALNRELREELGIKIVSARSFLELPFDYPHARVWLTVFLVDAFAGKTTRHGKEGQPTRWLSVEAIRHLDILAAVHPILDALQAPEALEALETLEAPEHSGPTQPNNSK